MNEFLERSIEYLKGVGPQRAELLRKELGIYNFQDLLHHYPFRYIDRSEYHSVSELPHLDSPAQLRGFLSSIEETGIGRKKSLRAKFQDDTGVIELIWFQGIKWIKPILKTGVEFQIYGKAKQYGRNWNMPHPEIIEYEKVRNDHGLQAVYSSTEKLTSAGLHSKGIVKLTSTLVEQLKGQVPDQLPTDIKIKHRLVGIEEALISIHQPQSELQATRARTRLKFEELFFLQLELLHKKAITAQKMKGFIFSDVGSYFNEFYNNHLPFDLTGAQKNVLKEIRKDFLTGHHMNRLVQGDVGSGKTLVALFSMLIAIGNGYQAAMIAPTEILANQHFASIQQYLEPLGLRVELLTGSTKQKDRKVLHEGLIDGSIHLLVGTHALLEHTVQFKNLGLVVIDEQHRFGVAQRAKMWRKNAIPPHVLIMTATPIPRTLAMTFYGDLDVSIIDELPPGRKPITTIHRYESHRLRLFGFIREEIKKGRQVYIVYPLINESTTLELNNLMEGFEAIQRAFPRPEYQVSIVHGQMKAEDKDFEMQRFERGETQIMVATTVIEVGVNIPNASVMVIENAERFGLSQLHQLRGRVGRGAEQSYCVLMTSNKLTKEGLTRMETMVRTNDGFEIAEVDLKLRGPGDLMGTQQSGMLQLKIADLSKDAQLVTLARTEARLLLEEDPLMEKPNHLLCRQKLALLMRKKPNWGKIA